MADEWDDEPAFETPTNASSFAEGTSFSRGRGYAPSKANDDDWGTGQNNSGESSGFGTENYSNENNGFDDDNRDGNRRGRGGGRGRGRGGRGGRGDRDGGDRDNNRRRRDDDNGFGDAADDAEKTGEDGEERKPPVTYIPPEIDEDDATVYGSGVAAGINFDDYDAIEVKISGENPPQPIQQFSDLSLRVLLMENIKKSGYTKPTPVQKHAIPIILSGRDMMACAQTGSGKTAAFMIPIIQDLLEYPRERVLTERGCEPQVVVMAPTRELADQICREAHKFAKETIVKCAAVYGGVKTTHQGDKLRSGIDIVVATPGRLNDFVSRGRVKFSSIRFIVLDEADRMLDQGFLPDMEKILNHESMVSCGERQTLMFSATFSTDVQKLCASYLKNYLFLTVGIVGAANKHIDQFIYEVGKKEKRSKLKELLEDERQNLMSESNQVKILVFVETKKTADFIAAFLCENDFPTTSIHGDRMQMEREKALSDFRSGRMPILVATSVAARGLDISNVSHVINFDLPKAAEDYVHRIGRTGRVGNKGKSISFYDPSFDSAMRDELVTILAQSGQPVPEFFGAGDGDFGDAGVANAFGGYDIRNNAGGGGGGANEPEEEW